MNVTKAGADFDPQELPKIKRKVTDIVSSEMKKQKLERNPTLHSSSDLHVSHVFLGQFIDDFRNKDEMYPPKNTPGIDQWFTFIKEHFRICHVETGSQMECVPDEQVNIFWQMKKPFHSMCCGFPLFVCGRITWLSRDDELELSDSDLQGFVKVRQGSIDPDIEDIQLQMNVYIDTNIRHDELPSNEEFVQNSICPQKDLPVQNVATPRWIFNSNAQACYGLFRYAPGVEMGTDYYPMIMCEGDGQLPPTRLKPLGSAAYPNPFDAAIGRQRGSVGRGLIAMSGGGHGAGNPATGDAASSGRGGGAGGRGAAVDQVFGGGAAEVVDESSSKRTRTKSHSFAPEDFRPQKSGRPSKVRGSGWDGMGGGGRGGGGR